jgi:hypothetical protein
MMGPLPPGTYSGGIAGDRGIRWEILEAGKSYQVVKEFCDSEMDDHCIGESWKFLGYAYNPFEESLSLYVSFDGRQEWHIPLLHSPQDQGVVLDNLDKFICEKK